MNEKILVINPGHAKAGTTTFQFLLKSLNVNILAKPTEDQTKTIWFKLFKERLFKSKYEIKKNEYNYYKLKNNFKDYLKSFFNNQKRVSVFSDEGMCGMSHYVRKTGELSGIYNLNIFKEVIEEIENELNIKIITKFVINIRKQHSIILSSYFYDAAYSKIMSVEDFFKKIIQSEDYKNLFDYTLLVKEINKIFNSEILILPLELLINDQKKYMDKFCKFIDLEVNIRDQQVHLIKNHIIKDGRKKYFLRSERFSPIYYLAAVIHDWLKKIKIYKKKFRNNTLLIIIYQIIKPKVKETLVEQNLELFQNEIKNLYKNSNLELEKIANINLKELGYY